MPVTTSGTTFEGALRALHAMVGRTVSVTFAAADGAPPMVGDCGGILKAASDIRIKRATGDDEPGTFLFTFADAPGAHFSLEEQWFAGATLEEHGNLLHINIGPLSVHVEVIDDE